MENYVSFFYYSIRTGYFYSSCTAEDSEVPSVSSNEVKVELMNEKIHLAGVSSIDAE